MFVWREDLGNATAITCDAKLEVSKASSKL
jgi:hypothetical protein